MEYFTLLHFDCHIAPRSCCSLSETSVDTRHNFITVGSYSESYPKNTLQLVALGTERQSNVGLCIQSLILRPLEDRKSMQGVQDWRYMVAIMFTGY